MVKKTIIPATKKLGKELIKEASFINCEKESKMFLEDGHIPISNNICERAIKPFAIMRRNVLFAKTEHGASISGRLFTIIQTARATDLLLTNILSTY